MGRFDFTDCPSCGAKDSMVLKTNVSKTYKSKNIAPFVMDDLQDHFCSECGDGIFRKLSQNKIRRAMAYHISLRLATITPLSELLTEEEFAKALGVSSRYVTKLIHQGRVEYAVHSSGLKFPIHSEVERLQEKW
ncbi:MAG: hypothetical protein AAF518_11040 [Spirochaetota bacterium]